MNAYDHFNLPRGLCGYAWVNILTLSSLRVKNRTKESTCTVAINWTQQNKPYIQYHSFIWLQTHHIFNIINLRNKISPSHIPLQMNYVLFVYSLCSLKFLFYVHAIWSPIRYRFLLFLFLLFWFCFSSICHLCIVLWGFFLCLLSFLLSLFSFLTC